MPLPLDFPLLARERPRHRCRQNFRRETPSRGGTIEYFDFPGSLALPSALGRFLQNERVAMARFLLSPAVACLLAAMPLLAADKPVRVFILAGQSNMEGKAPNDLLDHQAVDPKTRDLFAHLRKDDKWVVRDDVFIKFLDRKGPLTIGYGSPGRTGVELEFGTLMGNQFEEPVILIKAAWGGHSLYKLFRSPSAGYPAPEILQKELEGLQANVKKRNEQDKKNDPLPTMEDVKKEYGTSYRNTLAEVNDVMENYATMFPELKGKTLQLTGFVWFQGWNDQYGAQDEYASNMEHFIRDIRKDLHAPKLPFVIGVMGQNGSKPSSGAMLTIQTAQLAMNDVPDFKGNVKAIRTDVLVDRAAEDLYPTWQKNIEQWKVTGGDHAYHYLGSAIWFGRIGKAMGEAMRELLKDEK
jgi:alpha-galactosidase